jgi:hypothetical protein
MSACQATWSTTYAGDAAPQSESTVPNSSTARAPTSVDLMRGANAGLGASGAAVANHCRSAVVIRRAAF